MERVGSVLAILMALFFIISPSLALTIALNYPPNNAQTLDTTPTFNFTPTGSSSSYNCTLYIDGTNYGEATNIPNNTAAEITPTTALSTGDHDWNITCEGVGTTETGTSETRVIGIGENFSRCAVFIDPGTYKLTADIIDSSTSQCLNLQANDIVLDCQNHLVDGNDAAQYGVYIYRSSQQTTNITIKNCRIKDWDYANIILYYANGNTLENINSSSGLQTGILLQRSDSNILTNITAYRDETEGIYLFYSNSNILTNITAYPYGNSRGIHFYRSNFNTLKDSKIYSNEDNVYGIRLRYSENISIENADVSLSSSSYGVYIDKPANNLKIQDADITAGYGIYSASSEQMNNITIENVTITGYGNYYGIRLVYMNNVTMNNANTDNFYYGILISDYSNDIHIKNSYVKSLATNIACESDLCYHNKNIIVENVTVEGGNWGINIPGGDSANPVKNITIMNCKIYNTSYAGIVLRDQENVTVKNNILKGNAHSIRFVGTLKGDIYILNNYMNDTENIYWSDPDCSNARFILNTTKQTGTNIISGGFLAGNFWGKQDNTGFSQTCSDSNIDGICDNSFVINSSCNIIDYMPLSTKYDPTPPEITFLTESRAYSPGIISIKLTAQDNVIGCSLNISGTTYEMNKEGNTYWLNYTLAGPVWVYANCWDSADWRTNLSTKSLYLGVLTGGRGAGGYTPSPTSPTYYSLSITVSSPSPVTLFIYDTEGNLVEKLEYVTGYAYISLPEGKYLIKAISAEGKEQTYELALDRAKSIAVTFHQAFPYTESFAVAIILLGLLYAILKKKGFQKQV